MSLVTVYRLWYLLAGLTHPHSPVILPPDVTAAEIYSVARSVGFTPEAAVKMTAIALRESGGNPSAYREAPAPDGLERSYGLWQINMNPRYADYRLQLFGITKAEDLWSPQVNAAAAYKLSAGGLDSLLRQHWYIDRTGPPYYYAENYEKYLPAAMAAAGVSIPTPPTDDQPIEYRDGIPVFSTTVYARADDTPQMGTTIGNSAAVLLALLGLATVLLATWDRESLA